MFIVTFVGMLVHIYSLGYMKDDPARARYFGGLSLFMFSMTGIVLASNFIMMFIFWELVGLSSYLLIGHWFQKASACDAAKKAFLTNRIGDFGFMVGILILFGLGNGDVSFEALASSMANGNLHHAVEHQPVAHHPRRDRHLSRRRRQERPVPAARLAAGRDGRPDAGLRADPRRDDGGRGRLHACRVRISSSPPAARRRRSSPGPAASPRSWPR